MTPQALNKFISEFLVTVRKKEHNEEYEPNSLRTFFASFQRHSKKNKLWPYEKRPVRANSESASVTGQEYLEFNERETKTRSRNDPRNVKAIAPKMFAVPNNQKCPARAYKVYAEKRTAEMETNDAPFTLTVNNVKSGNNDVPQTDIMQLSGHKNVQSITRHSTVSQKQQLNMSHTLTGFSS